MQNLVKTHLSKRFDEKKGIGLVHIEGNQNVCNIRIQIIFKSVSERIKKI